MKQLRAILVHLFMQIKTCLEEAYVWMLPKELKCIKDDIILITGGGRGIGQKLALEFVKYHPKHIIVCGRTESSLYNTSKAIQEQGVNCAYMICDVKSREQVFSMAQEVEAKFGHVSILVNNAGVVYGDSILEAKPDDLVSQLKTNTISNFWTIKAFLPSMLERNHGHLVQVNSMLGWSGLNGAAGYCMSKFASSGLSDALREELCTIEQNEVHLTTVYPYHVDNAMFAGISTRFPKLFPPVNEDYLADKIVKAVLRNRSWIMVPKLMYAVAWFYSVAPVKAVTAIMKLLRVHKAMDQQKETQRGNSKAVYS